MGLLALALASGLAAAPLLAQEDDWKPPFQAKPETGRVLALKLCAGCHIVAPDQDSVAQAGIPSFMAIASFGRDDQYLIDKMIHPYPPMIDAHLSDHEMRHLVAYIHSLQK
jgi:cytochrome c553